MCSAQPHVCFTPDSDRESGHPQEFMSALPPEADMCGALRHVCFGPKADSFRLRFFCMFLCAVYLRRCKIKLESGGPAAFMFSRSAVRFINSPNRRQN